MGFLAPALLGGMALVALPVVLHLVMRREPKKVEFPALRFVRVRQSTNQHRLQLRHWLLLALRALFILLLALALARPVLRGSGLLGSGQAGLATALVFDTSPRMDYQQNKVTRLEEAKELATWLLEQLPADTEVALIESGRSRRARLASRDAALVRADRLRTTAAAAPLAEAIVEAVKLVNERPDHRREVYVFTDLAQAAWNDVSLAAVNQALEQAEGVKVFLVDVGAKQLANAGLGGIELSAEHLATGETLNVRADFYRLGKQTGSGEATVELWLAGPDGKNEKRGERSVASDQGPTASVEFPVAGLRAGTHQGYLHLVGDDALPIDNRRYFSIGVESPPRVLLVGQTERDTFLLREALAPSALSPTAAPQFLCESIPFDQLESAALEAYDAVVLVDPRPPTTKAWRKLAAFARSGGGVALFLGKNAVGHLKEFSDGTAQQLLPAQLRWISTNARYLQPMSYQHPVLKGLADIGQATPWPAFPVFKSWQLGKLDPTAMVVARFADGSPAIVEGSVGSGRVLLIATPITDASKGDPWNLLATNPDPWPFLALVEGIADYLVGAENRPLNYRAGQVVSLPLPRRSDLATYVLEPPVGDPLPQRIAPGQQEIVVTNSDEVGNYRVVSGGKAATLNQGFSINAPGNVGRLERASFESIALALGAKRVALARSRKELSSSIDLGRVGRELYPWLIALVALILGAEQWLADRFYKGE